ncbi:MAG: SUMF1/EgtB/PvdO family nonheme iron enzyme [Candidatus Competibacteraceae bacterium]|nr:SUMF1/EgtB/PvdO family nonheme iron enzyme [Candidatus Competibacteraceae bacterium]
MRLEELAQAYAAGQLNETELARRQEEALRVMNEEGNGPRSSVGALAVNASSATDPAGSPAPCFDTAETLEVGRVIGPPERLMRLMYELSGKGHIWLARVVSQPPDRSATADEFRAIKIFLPAGYDSGVLETSRDERASRADLIGLRSYLAKVRARVELAVRLDHPAIVRVHGWRQGADGWPFAEMDYIDPRQGRTLAQWLDQEGQHGLPWEVIAKWLRPLASALDYTRREHRVACQHLDTDTVFITDQGTVKLLGFGLATEIREPRSVLFSTSGAGRETASEGGESVAVETAFRRDVFALALLIYHLLTGHSLHEAQGESPGATPRPSGLTDEAWQLLRRGLAYPSELCPVDAGQFIQGLEAAQRSAIAAPSSHGLLPKWVWGLGAGVILAIGLVFYGLRTPVEPGVDAAPDTTTAQSGESASVSSTPEEEQAREGRLLKEAERETDARAFEAAQRVDTVAAYRLYLQRCPQCGYGKEARAAVQALESRKQIDALKADFEALASALEEGHEERGDAALSRLNTLAELVPDDPVIAAGRERLARGWAKIALNSLNQSDPHKARRSLQRAESAYPELPELIALKQALKDLEAAEHNRQTDAEAFAAARRVDTRRAYWTYLERCATDCKHRAEAEAALARLAPPNPVLRDRLSDGSPGPEMVVIPAGVFRMGSPSSEPGRYSDEPIRQVRIDKPFAIGKYELMFHEYERFAAAKGKSLPNDHDWGRGRRPVINVSWTDATAYAEWLSEQTGQRYRLPTEAEWEYAARAGTTSSRYWGDDPNEGCAFANAADLDGKKVFVGWTAMQCHDGQVYTAPAGSYRSNDFGLHDMAGNVLEWTCSLYDKESPAPVHRCQEPSADQEFVVRGGSWSDEPRNVRSADRHRSRFDFRDYFLGFRLVRELP